MGADRRRSYGRLAVLAVTVVVVTVVAVSLFSGRSAVTHRAQVQDRVVINSADLAVTIRVTNTGKAAGTPQCTVQASDPSGAYSGTDLSTLKGTS